MTGIQCLSHASRFLVSFGHLALGLEDFLGLIKPSVSVGREKKGKGNMIQTESKATNLAFDWPELLRPWTRRVGCFG